MRLVSLQHEYLPPGLEAIDSSAPGDKLLKMRRGAKHACESRREGMNLDSRSCAFQRLSLEAAKRSTAGYAVLELTVCSLHQCFVATFTIPFPIRSMLFI